MNFKTKCTILLISILCFSCVSTNKNKTTLYCNDFDVKFVNNNFGEMLFFDDLKKAILSKLRILAKTKQNMGNKTICLMKIDVSRSNFTSIINNAGDIGRENIDVGVKYELASSEVAITGFVKTFYGNNASGYPYSDYIKNKKNRQNEIDSLAEDIFMDIVRQIN